ncbi:hypothetical protein VCHE48_0617 [Vibrio cholerae HE48]|nr:hypothetical protein VCHE48_0617 [Vibrio cholerae HE48]
MLYQKLSTKILCHYQSRVGQGYRNIAIHFLLSQTDSKDHLSAVLHF